MRGRRTVITAVAVAVASVACTTPPEAPDVPPAPTTSAPTASDTDVTQNDAPEAEVPGTTPAPPEIPVARTEVAGAVWNGDVIVAAGFADGLRATDLVHAWTPGDVEWRPLRSLPVALDHTVLVVHEDALWAVGGYATIDGTRRATDRTWVLETPDGSWVDGPPLDRPRAAHAAVSTAAGLTVIGGVGLDDSGTGTTLASTATLPSGSGTWVAGPSLVGPAEHLAAAARADGTIVVLGGRTAGLETATAATTVLDLTAATATVAAPMQEARSGFAATTVGGLVCTAGGEVTGGTVGPIECFDGEVWQVIGELSTPRHGVAVVAVRDALHVIGGGPEPSATYSTVHERILVPR